jgi:quercetin dioxygenase-like cupin family protein
MFFVMFSTKKEWGSPMSQEGRLALKDTIEYSDGSIVSKALVDKSSGSVTLFAFDKDEKLSEHTAPFDAMVQVLEGKAEIIIDDKKSILTAGEFIVMPANVPHAINASERFKMLLTMIKL